MAHPKFFTESSIGSQNERATSTVLPSSPRWLQSIPGEKTIAKMNKRILIIEDQKDIVEVLRYNLEKEKGFVVSSASNGDEGLNLALQTKPSLIILDIGLPGLNGYEVCRALRREAATRDVPILMVTARVSESDKVLGLELGADDYITKPFGIRELVARVRSAISRRENERQAVEVFDDGRLYVHFGDYVLRFDGQEPKLT